MKFANYLPTFLLLPCLATEQRHSVDKDNKRAMDVRVKELISRLTLGEKNKLNRMPLKKLNGLKRGTGSRGGEQNVEIQIPVKDLLNGHPANDKWKNYSSNFELIVGDNSQNKNVTLPFTIAALPGKNVYISLFTNQLQPLFNV